MSAETQQAVAEARARIFAKAKARDYGAGPIPPRYDGPNTWTRLVNDYEAKVRADEQSSKSSGFDSGFDAGFS